jgi:hypothetical protein
MTFINTAFYICIFFLYIVLFWILILVVETSIRGFWVDKDSLIRNLENQGYREIKIMRHSWFLIALRGGKKDDIAKFVISAKNPQGKRKIFDVWVKSDPNPK